MTFSDPIWAADQYLWAGAANRAYPRLAEMRDRMDPGFVQALRISLTIAIVSAMVLSEQYVLPFWLVGGLAAAIWAHGQRRAAESASERV